MVCNIALRDIMGEMKFRQLVNGRWHYFGFIDGTWIGPVTPDVDKNPVVQYIWREDIHGDEMYTNDIVKIHVDPCNQKSLWQNKHVGFITYDSESASYYIKNNFMKNWLSSFDGISYEIIGNIYENPNLLEQSK